MFKVEVSRVLVAQVTLTLPAHGPVGETLQTEVAGYKLAVGRKGQERRFRSERIISSEHC